MLLERGSLIENLRLRGGRDIVIPTEEFRGLSNIHPT
jgi:hypothetical protein